jgi:hypothetical protein
MPTFRRSRRLASAILMLVMNNAVPAMPMMRLVQGVLPEAPLKKSHPTLPDVLFTTNTPLLKDKP